MRRVQQVFATAFLLAAAGSSSFAADMPVKALPAQPAPVQAYNWTGWYVGGHIGYGWGHDDTTIGFNEPAGAGIAAAIAGGAIPVSFSPNPRGALGGLQLGYNYQFSPQWVVGAETDFSFSNINGSQTINTTAPGFLALTESVSQKLDWFGTVRARFGYAANNWLFYGTGGGAYGHVKYSFALSNVAGGGPVNIAVSDSKTQWGWTVGGGIEYGWSHWSARVEYLYMDLGDHAFTAPLNTSTTSSFIPNFTNKYHIVRAGLNYHF